jgi:hypothetical protein
VSRCSLQTQNTGTLVNFASPLARALIGKKKGSEIRGRSARGPKEDKVLTVDGEKEPIEKKPNSVLFLAKINSAG